MRLSVKKAAILVAFLVANPGVNAQSEIKHIPYGQHQKQTFDLFLPAIAGKTTPVLILIHGGGWVMGGNEHTERHARNLRDRGLIVANVDYRPVSESVHGKDLIADIANAVEKVKAVSADHGFAPGGYHMSGISAGAHLALMYSYTTDKPVKSVTAMCAPTRLDDPGMLDVVQRFNLTLPVQLLAETTLENKPENLGKLKNISPYAHVKNIPAQLIHGDRDELVPIAQAKFLYEILQREKIDSRLIVMEGKGHDVGMNERDSEQKVLEAIVDWVNAHQ